MRSRAFVFVACVFVAVPVLTAIRQGTVHALEAGHRHLKQRHERPAPPASPLDRMLSEAPEHRR